MPEQSLFSGAAEAGITLSSLQQLIANSIRMTPGVQNVWVRAEFSDLRMAGGHCYMELVEKDDNGGTRAKLRAMIWSGTLRIIRQKFFAETGRDLASGLKVLVRGSAAHHPLYGLSFNISDIDPKYTMGDMERLRREILERLAREGLIDRNKRLPVPPAPQRIAIISAEGAAGYGDFINQLKHNPDGFAVYTGLFPAVMQGERTVPTVLEALGKVAFTADMWDAVVIIRGGGATTDLNSFDNYELARAVATFPLPVIVGIGHERDRTVLDEIACVRCKTPTAVAEYIVGALRDAYSHMADTVRRIARYAADAIKGEYLRLANLGQAIPARAHNSVMRQNLIIDRIAMRLKGAAAGALQRQQARVTQAENLLRVLSPDNTLRRGYSITRVNGHAVTDPSQVKTGDEIVTTLASGIISSTAK